MDWIDIACRDIAEMPDRTSPADDPAALIATPEEIRTAITNALEAEGLAVVPRDATEEMVKRGMDAVLAVPYNTSHTHPVDGWGALPKAAWAAMLPLQN